MPEGPEILFCATFYKKYLDNSIITDVTSYTSKKITLPDDYIGKVLDVDCKGKLMWFHVSGKNKKTFYIHIHYGLKGWITSEEDARNIKYMFSINNQSNLYLDDAINYSSVSILNELEHEKIIDGLGVDIFSSKFTLELFKKEITKRKSLLAGFILNQKIFAGIGNYIKNESIYMSKLNIHIKTNQLSDDDIDKLYKNILYVSYSQLITLIKKANLKKSNINKNKLKNMPKQTNSNYVYKIYKRNETDDGQLVIKTKVSGRDSYSTKELSN